MANILYFAAGSCAFVSLAAAAMTGMAFEPRRLDLAAGDQRNPDFLEINPLGRVPVLVVDGQPITEALGILAYIDRRYPEAGLIPRDPVDAARAYELLSWFTTGVQVSFSQIFRGARFADDEQVREVLKVDGKHRVIEALERIEAMLGKGWLLGNQMTIVDAYLVVFVRWATGKLGIDMSAYPKIDTAAKTFLASPAAAKATEWEAAPLALAFA